jgi:hypothetical protein
MGVPQADLGEAPTFRPTREEFADPFTFIANVAEQFVKHGIAKIVPPKGACAPPQHVQQLWACCSRAAAAGSAGSSSADGGTGIDVQRQFLSHLCKRGAPGAAADAAAAAALALPGSRCAWVVVELVCGVGRLTSWWLFELLVASTVAALTLPHHPSAPCRPGLQQVLDVQQLLGSDAAVLNQLHAAAAGGPQQQGEQQAGVAVKHEQQPEQQEQEQQSEPQQQQQQQQPPLPSTLRAFAAYDAWLRRTHFSCQPFNAVDSAQAGNNKQRQGAAGGLPPAKRLKPDPDQQQQQDDEEEEEQEQEQEQQQTKVKAGSDGCDDGDSAEADEGEEDGSRQQPGHHSGRRHAKPKSAAARGHKGGAAAAAAAAAGGAGELSVGAIRATKAAAASSTTSATPPTTPRTKAVKSGSRLAGGGSGGGAAPGTAGLAAVFPDPSAVSIDQVEAELWRIVEQQQPGRVMEVLHVPHLASSSSSTAATQEGGGGGAAAQATRQGAWDLSSLPTRRHNVLRYLPLQPPLPGLTEPVLGVSSCLSTQCWQVAPQGMYGISCLHAGAPRVRLRGCGREGSGCWAWSHRSWHALAAE